MPFRSKAQQGFMHAAEARGEIPEKVVKHFDAATTAKQFAHLPEHVKMAIGGIVRHFKRRSPEEEREDLLRSAFGGHDLDEAEGEQENKERYDLEADPKELAYAHGGEATCPHCGYAHGGRCFAEGGEIPDNVRPDDVLGTKRDRELPRHELDVYRGEGVPRGVAPDREDEDDGETALAAEQARRRKQQFAHGGEARDFAEHLVQRSRLNPAVLRHMRGK